MEQKENKMGTMPVNKLLINMSLPLMISMMVQALYNIVDSVFVSRIGEDALTAVSLAFPVQSLIIALSGGTCVGVNAVVSKALGEKNYDKANKSAGNGIFLSMLSFIVFFLVGMIAVEPFYLSQTKSLIDREQALRITTYGIRYLKICCMLSFGIFFQMTFERLLQSTGKTFYTMITQSTGAIINIILDPILIFGLCGMPKLGVTGAAIATVTGQIIAGGLAYMFHVKKNHDLKVTQHELKPMKDIILKIYSVGVPSIIMQSVGSIMVFGINKILMSFTATASAVFGAYFKVQSFIFMPVFGLNNSVIPILAYNYGAKNRERIEKTIKDSMVYAISIMLFGTFLFQVIPGQLLSLFDASEEMLRLGIPALRIISILFPFAGFAIISSGTFQAFGNGVNSLILSVLRQLVLVLPAAYLLSLSGNVNYVWFAFPAAEIIAVFPTAYMLKVIKKKTLSEFGQS